MLLGRHAHVEFSGVHTKTRMARREILAILSCTSVSKPFFLMVKSILRPDHQ